MPLAFIRSPPSAATRPASAPAPAPALDETDLDRALKLIPGEVISFYAPAWVLGSQVHWRPFAPLLFFATLLLVPAILRADGRATGVTARWPQYLVRSLAFVAWAFTLGWPFAAWVDFPDHRTVAAIAVLAVPVVGALLLRPPAPPPA